MNAINKKRGWAKAHISRACEASKKIEEPVNVEALANRLQKLEQSFSELTELSKQLYDYEDHEGFIDPVDDILDYEEKYFTAHALLSTLLKAKNSELPCSVKEDSVNKLAGQQAAFLERLNETQTISNIHLPKIQVPSFSGTYQDWPSFRDLFTGAIDQKTNLTSTQKFHYLKSYLSGEALQLVKHLALTDANYLEAWDRLTQRYDRKPLIVRSFIQTFLSLPTCHATNAHTLRKITDGADEVIRGLNALNSNQRDPWLIHIILSKVDDETKKDWAESSDAITERTFEELLQFLVRRCDALEACQATTHSTSRRSAVVNFANSSKVKNNNCVMQCTEVHTLTHCPKFKALDVNARRALVKNKKLCYNCLGSAHQFNKCLSSVKCRVCYSSHHTLLHFGNNNKPKDLDRPSEASMANTTTNNTSEIQPIVSNHSIEEIKISSQTILPTVLARVNNNMGTAVNCRILIDTGSTASFVTEAFVQLIGAKRKHARVPIIGLSSRSVGNTRGRANFTLKSTNNENKFEVEALILQKLTSTLPSHPVNLCQQTRQQIKQLSLADPTFGIPSPVDMILGSDQLWKILTGEKIQLKNQNLNALNSAFGWVITGSCLSEAEYQMQASVSHALEDVDHLVRSLLEMDNLQSSKSKISEHDPVEKYFSSTVERASDGTYVVKYPFKADIKPIDDTLPQAISRLNNMDAKLQRQPELKQQYKAFLDEYLELKHMEKIPKQQINVHTSKRFYLAHHPVIKKDSSTTKCRVVFDGSMRDSSGVSLNDRLHIGPPIQRDLFGVVLRFRQHRYVFATDIEKMFRGIRVHPDHTDYQRILVRNEQTSNIEHYRLLTVTYGLAPSPFLAVRVLKQIAEDYKMEYPNASHVLENDAYVDDIPTGCDTVEGLIALKDELIQLLSKANLNLRKWSSNCWPLLETLPKAICEFNPIAIHSQTSETSVKILGLHWNPSSDQLLLNIGDPVIESKPTKRIVLSETSKIYDPLGMVAPVVVLFKVLFQESWCYGLGWDDPLPEMLCKRWCNYMGELHHLKQLKIPRYISYPSKSVELIGFSDASTVACAAVVYCRVHIDGTCFIRLIASKTRVAPLKPISVPRLELNAALLLTRLITLVKESLTLKISNIVCWTDSEIVLHWLSSPPRRWATFISNRTAEILDVIPRNQWRHVRSEDNPADCASRGLLPLELVQHTLWWSGPSWLALPEESWPSNTKFNTSSSDPLVLAEENRKAVIALCANELDHPLLLLCGKLSSWWRLIRVVAYCIRFINKTSRRREGHCESFLSTNELKDARNHILKCVQWHAFAKDISQLQKSQQIHPKSTLIRYSPFIDQFGVLRVGGRIKNADINYNIKFPILLPKDGNLSLLIVRHTHEINMHAGVEATFALVRQEFWILGCRNLVRKVVFNCKICFLQRRAISTQLMGNLPSVRVQPSRCFLHCGLDYAGPVRIKYSKTRNPKIGKAWFAIFVCLSTKALHIELVSDLTTDAFIASFRRFIARRGKPSDLYSDNGTTFHGAKRALNELQHLSLFHEDRQELAQSLANEGVNWHFIPPSAPHFGGLWETGVRSIKLHLKRVVGDTLLTFEEYSTVLCQIEAILNSRPLSSISDTDLDPLTPAHFLIGEPYTCIPEPSSLIANTHLKQHWRHLQTMVQGFWNRWHTEYLTSLQQRNKWQQSTSNIEIGKLVVLKEPNLPPSKWILGRIVEVHKGDDNLIRVVTVKTNKGEYKRPISKVATLPF